MGRVYRNPLDSEAHEQRFGQRDGRERDGVMTFQPEVSGFPNRFRCVHILYEPSSTCPVVYQLVPLKRNSLYLTGLGRFTPKRVLRERGWIWM